SRMRVGGNTSWLLRALVPVASAAATEPAKDTIRLSISTNVPDSGRADQRVSAGPWKNNNHTPPPARGGATRGALAGGAPRRARPGRARGGAVGHPDPKKRLARGKGVALRRCPPDRPAAEEAPAAPEFHRHEIVIAGGEMRAGEAHQHAALFEPVHEAIARLGDVADVSEDQHRQPLLDELVHALRRRAAVGEPYIGEGPERAREVVGRGQRRLRGVDGRAGDNADRAPPPPLVEQRHRAGRALAGDFQPRDVVADLDRQRELGLALALAVLEGE